MKQLKNAAPRAGKPNTNAQISLVVLSDRVRVCCQKERILERNEVITAAGSLKEAIMTGNNTLQVVDTKFVA